MGYEERMDAMSDFITENTPNCDDCTKYDKGVQDGLSSRLHYHLERMNEARLRIDTILATYDPDDLVMNEIKKLFGKLWALLFNEDTKEFLKPCPCRKECKF